MDVLAIMALVFGLVEFSKKFGVKDRAAQVLAFGLGLFLVGFTKATEQGLLPSTIEPWFTLIVTTFMIVLGAMGFYEYGKKLRA